MVRRGTLALASHTGGWAKEAIMRMPVSEFLWWLDGLPRQGG
jgi:outer membrane biogenesis lipoprotein LolB